ncbi:MAG: GTPase Era [Candidatus Cloacimonas sp. 4484_275]|nr:MAG: GTPase Era [Candidatus Cloacimonas sp. 4484_275]RLC50482.1 MAG: GTPase Era [Candidatus Cloacimonadota bacterium]
MVENSNFRCGFVSIVGKPNVGKSTLMNKILKEKISIISPKPQTTRHQIKGILNDENRQIIFLDTPGYLKPRYELQKKMLEYLQNSLKDSDLIIFITDAKTFPTDYDKELLQLIEQIKLPKLAILNKIDLVDKATEEIKIRQLQQYDFEKVLSLSVLETVDFGPLIETISAYLPLNPPFYDQETISDLPMRFFVQEIIREQIFHIFRQEIPYATTVVVESYKELPNKIEIAANIWLERKSQKMIIIGRNGEMIKKIRENSEKEIHNLVGKRVVLHLWIKIKPNWRKKKNALKEFGYR